MWRLLLPRFRSLRSHKHLRNICSQCVVSGAEQRVHPFAAVDLISSPHAVHLVFKSLTQSAGQSLVHRGSLAPTMTSIWAPVLYFLLLHLCCLRPPALVSCQSVWPEPQQKVTKKDVYVIDGSSFDFVLGADSSSGCDVVERAFQRYREAILRRGCPGWKATWRRKPGLHHRRNHRSSNPFLPASIPNSVLTLRNLTVYYRTCDPYPSTYMDEMYTLSIGSVARALDFDPADSNEVLSLRSGPGTLVANSAWGVLRGLETFSQLVYRTSTASSDLLINGTFILDFPRFTFRGILLDTARHFIPVPVLKQNLDAMAMNKMNVFHWHIVDDQSFPYESTTFPLLHENGAYNSETHVYTQRDIADVIEYARLRGIRVVPEFDTPGHTLSWGKGQEDLLSVCYDEHGHALDGEFGPIDPSKQSTYLFLSDLMREIVEVFPDKFVHLGGDEVDFKCWENNPGIQDFMEQLNITKIEKLEEHYMTKLVDIVSALNKSYVVWQEVLDNNVTLKQDTIINVWKSGDWTREMEKVTKAGHQTILSAPWYLNYIHYGSDWHLFYESEPTDFNGTDQQKKLVVGGSACMWSEYVDGSEIVPRLWPRASSVAERLWSSKDVNDVAAARPRIKHHQCYMQTHGIRVEPIDGPGFCPCDQTYV